MQRTARAKNVVTIESKSAEANCTAKALTESQAAEIMWVHYRDNKTQLISDIKEYRAGILAQLMEGVPVEQVFAPYFKPAEPAKPARRAA
jgi:hypothetical protein